MLLIKRSLFFLLLLFLGIHHPLFAQSFCDLNGNVIIYSNYDGGYLNINVDQNIPNLKIGVTTYEDCEVNITGAYAGNVTQVMYAGYQGDNQHCNPSPLTTSVLGVPANIVSVLLYPPATWINPNGHPTIICNYQCDSAGYNGGCNTPDQIAHFYLTQFGGALYYHFTQYGCWSGTYNISDGGNCCIGAYIIQPQYNLTAGFFASTDTLCVEQGINFTNTTYSSYPGTPTYNWDFGDGSPDQNTVNAVHGYTTTGTFTVTLTVTDSSGMASDTATFQVVVTDCGADGVAALKANQITLMTNIVHDMMVINDPDLAVTGLQVQDVLGRMLLTDNDFVAGSRHVLAIHDLPSGMYLLRVGTLSGWYTLKWLKD